MLINKIKTFIITFLVVLAIYQTARLWLEDFSRHSFFSFFKNEAISSQEEMKYMLESISINTGSNKFIKKMNNIYESELKEVFDLAITTTLKLGEFKGKEAINWNHELSNKCVIYKYSCELKNDTLKKIFNAKKSAYDKIGNIDMIIIKPDRRTPESIRVDFVNNNEQVAYSFELTQNKTISEVYNQIVNINDDESPIYYVSSVQDGVELFNKNLFLPRWTDKMMEYSPIIKSNPMEEDGGVLLATLEKNIDVFFENPAIKWKSTVNDVYTYTDENSVVKYYTTGVLEYSNYRSLNQKSTNTFYNNYMGAVNFIKKDSNIKNEYYLTDTYTDEDKTVFCFDYKINDFPIVLNDEYKKKINMNSIIEVTVSKGNVLKYRRLVYDFMPDENNTTIANVDFLNAVDTVLSLERDKNIKPDDIFLGYNIDNINSDIALNWFISLDGNLFLEDTVK